MELFSRYYEATIEMPNLLKRIQNLLYVVYNKT